LHLVAFQRFILIVVVTLGYTFFAVLATFLLYELLTLK